MSVNSVGFVSYDLKKMTSIGPGGCFDPDKCKTQPNCIWTKQLTPEEKEKLAEFIKDSRAHIKPGLIDPRAEENAEKAKKAAYTIGGAALAAFAAFIFRGNIKAGAQKLIQVAAPYVKKAVAYVKNTKVFDTVKNAAGGLVQKAKTYAPKVVANVKSVAAKAAEWCKNIFKAAK